MIIWVKKRDGLEKEEFFRRRKDKRHGNVPCHTARAMPLIQYFKDIF